MYLVNIVKVNNYKIKAMSPPAYGGDQEQCVES